MSARSWHRVAPDPPAHALPADIAARDPLGGRDVGWVNQMRPFVREFCPPGGLVFDPFCGFGTTLLAAALEGRNGAGTEIDPARAALARERLARHGVAAPVVVGSVVSALPCTADAPEHRACDLVLTNVPYFGCTWPGADGDGQSYLADDYATYLHGLRDVFHALRRHVVDGGYVIAMCENVRVGGRLFPQAFDLARILAGLYTACDERVLCYPPRVPGTEGVGTADGRESGPGQTDRAHEYALVFRKQRERIDLAATSALLVELRNAGFAVEVYGSFAAWQADPANAREPADLDLRLPRDQAQLARLLAWLHERGFELTLWGEPLAMPPDLATLDRHGYLRAQRRDRRGSLVRMDVAIRA